MHSLKRRDIRIKVLQALYAYELTKDPVEKIKKDLLLNEVDEDNKKFADDLIHYCLSNSESIDNRIKGKVENWEIERIALIDRIILRMGISELMYFPEIPPKVSINEAIDIAKDFCTKNSGKFVNGILDAILEDLIKENKLVKTGRGLLNLKKKSNHKRENSPG
jgi:transcription antitermination protein NusB